MLSQSRPNHWTMSISGLTLVKIILLGLTILSTYLNIDSAFFQGKTETVRTTRNLSQMEFPVIFKLSVTGLMNITRIMKTHLNVASYFNGISGKSDPQFYWTDRNGSKTVQGSKLSKTHKSFLIQFYIFQKLTKIFWISKISRRFWKE